MMKLGEHIRFNSNQDGSVVLDVLRGQMYGLNPVGSAILDLVAQGLDRAQIKSEISRRFSVDIAIVERDVDEFLSALAGFQVIESGDDRPVTRVHPAGPR